MNVEPRSQRANRLDLEITSGHIYATAEVKETAAGFVCHWLVSGQSSVGLPTMFLDLSVPLASATEKARLTEAEDFARKFLLPMAVHLSKTKGAGDRIPPLSVVDRLRLFEAHMAFHFESGKVEGLTLQRQTEALFNMATFMQVVAPLKSIANFQNVSVGTVETRVKKGRAAGAIPKASEVRARKESLKKGA